MKVVLKAPLFMTGADYAKWVEVEEKRHEVLMKDAGFLAAAGN